MLPRCSLPKETKTKMLYEDGLIKSTFYNNGHKVGQSTLMYDIVDVVVIHNDKNKVIIVKFSDGSEEKAVLDLRDEFSLEYGISICITKKLIGGNTTYGSSLYNKIIKRALNVMETNNKEREADKVEAELSKQNALKKREKYLKYVAKVQKKKEEKEIEIRKEAYKRAILELKEEGLKLEVYKK